MKLEQLQSIFENATEEQLNKITELFSTKNKKDDDLVATLQKENDTLRTDLLETKNKIKELSKNQKNNDDLQNQINELQKTLQEKEEQYTRENEERRVDGLINETLGTKKFVNEQTKLYYQNILKTELLKDENKNKSAKELFEKATNGVEGIFLNEQQEKLEIPPVGNTLTGALLTREQIKAMSPAEINKNWELVSNSLKEVK